MLHFLCIHTFFILSLLKTAHQALADVEALKECLFATEIKEKMETIRVRTAKEVEREWHTRVRIRTDTKRLMFNFGKSVSYSIIRKIAKERISYAQIEELFVKSQSKQAFCNAVKTIFNCSQQTREKIYGHFSQLSKANKSKSQNVSKR